MVFTVYIDMYTVMSKDYDLSVTVQNQAANIILISCILVA